MAARFPQSGSSLGWHIKAAYAGKILAIYWAASADSVHRLYSADTATTILTRSTSGAASFNVPGNAWTSFALHASAPSFDTVNAGSHIVAAPISTHGVIAFVFGNANQIWLYKHA